MAKVALLVEFAPRTRVIVDVPDGQTLDDYLNNDDNYDNIIQSARQNMLQGIEDYLSGDNSSVEEDAECPYGTFDSDAEPDENAFDKIITYKRDGYGFRNYFNAGLNRETCQCDEEGVDVYEKDAQGNFHYLNAVPNTSVSDLEDMTDEEFDEWLNENGIY